jgi:hypothetical protein
MGRTMLIAQPTVIRDVSQQKNDVLIALTKYFKKQITKEELKAILEEIKSTLRS